MADLRSRAVSKPYRYRSMVAAAEVMTRTSLRNVVRSDTMLEWQERAWGFYDEVGEFRFGVGWIANAMSRVNLVAARAPRNIGDEPVPLSGDDPDLTEAERRAIELVRFIGGGPAGQGQLNDGFARLLTVSGLAWLVAEPDRSDPEATTFEHWDVYSQRSSEWWQTRTANPATRSARRTR